MRQIEVIYAFVGPKCPAQILLRRNVVNRILTANDNHCIVRYVLLLTRHDRLG